MPALLANDRARQSDNGGQSANGNGDPAAQRMLPFVAGARPSRRLFADDTNAVVAGATTQVGPTPVVASGFLRSILLYVEITGGDGTTTSAVATDRDAFRALERVRLMDTSGATIVESTGYQLYLANKYLPNTPALVDPRSGPAWSAIDSDGNASFVLRVPVEVSGRDGYGALGNQNSSQAYQLEYAVAAGSDLYDTSPSDALPDVRVRAYLESWTPPPSQGPAGNPIAQAPPAHGSMQFIRTVPYDVESGSQEVRIQRVGNFYRALIVTKVDSSGDLDTAGLPDEIELSYDHSQVDRAHKDVIRNDNAHRYGLDAAAGSPGGPDPGTIVYQWDDDQDGIPGWGSRRQFLATTVSTDLRIIGEFNSAGKLYVTTVDVAPTGAFVGT